MGLLLSYFLLLLPFFGIIVLGILIYIFIGIIKLYKKTKLVNFDRRKTGAFLYHIEDVLGIKINLQISLIVLNILKLLFSHSNDNNIIMMIFYVAEAVLYGFIGYQFSKKVGFKHQWLAIIFPLAVASYIGYSSKYLFVENNWINKSVNNNKIDINKNDKYVCKKCGNICDFDYSFCNVCGEKIIKETPIKEIHSNFCSRCGKDVQQDAKFCIYCGNSLK